MEYFQGRGGTPLPGLAHTMGLNAVDQATRDTGRRASIDKRKAAIEQQNADEADAKRWHEQHLRDVGTGAVDTEMDKVLTEQSVARMQEAKARRATAGREGEAAVKDALRPADIRALIQQMMQPPAYTPEESAAIAQAMGPTAVEGAIRPPPQGPAGWYPPGGAPAPMPMTPPGTVFGPQETTPQGYASGATRAAHWGPKAVEQEILGKEEQE